MSDMSSTEESATAVADKPSSRCFLMERMILLEPSTGRRLRVVQIHPDLTWLMPINEKGWEFSIETARLNAKLDAGQYVEQPLGDSLPKTAGAALHGDEMYERFGLYLSDTRKLLSGSGRMSVFKTMVEHDPVGPSTFYKTVRRWLEGGCIPQALAAHWKGSKKGLEVDAIDGMSFEAAKNLARTQAERLMRLGKPEVERPDHRKDGKLRRLVAPRNPTGFTVDLATLRVFKLFYQRKEDVPAMRLTTLYGDMLREVFSTQSPIGNTDHWPSWAVPSWSQFRDRYYALTSFSKRRKTEKGEHHFLLNERARPGQNVSAGYSAGLVGSADATIWNVELVSATPEAERRASR